MFRPPVTDDYVSRKRLESVLEEGRQFPIILVAAPAGYGKTTQVSHWIARTGVPCVWLSLDNSHNDLGVLLRHIEAGIGDWSPTTAELLRKITQSLDLPPANHIADAISTHVSNIDDELILVLDDYHVINNSSIHLFVESLLMHLPDSLRVAIVSRRTPPIALSRLRSRNLVLDIRLHDLQFDRSATHALFKAATGEEVDDTILAKLEQFAEGWPAGLRMLLLAMSGNEDVHTYLEQFGGNIWQIQEYLVDEVVSKFPPNVARSIPITAVVGRFSADLCESLIASTEEAEVTGNQLVDLVRNRGLFCVPLDERGEWFRYHHLFRELLLNQVRSRYSEAEIQHFHTLAAQWFDDDGQLEEAIRHHLLSSKSERAADVILRHKGELIIQQQWRRLDRLLNMLPTELIERNVQLLVLLAWTTGRMGRISQEMEAARLAQQQFDKAKETGTVDDVTYGQICALRSTVEYHLGNGEDALVCAEKALKLLPPHHIFERGEASMIRGVAQQMLGDPAGGRRALFEALEQSGSDIEIFRARILMGICYLDWPNGDLQELQQYASMLLELGQARDDGQAIVHACWFGGAALYHLNELDAAADVVRQIIEEKWWPHQRSYINCVQIMSLVLAVRGEHVQALELCESLVRQMLESRATYHLPEIYALQAGIALLQGDHGTAIRWALEFETGELTAAWGFSVPALTAARILLHSESTEALDKARAILDAHQLFFDSINNTRFLIETLALQAMLCTQLGDEDTANQLLTRAVTLAQPGGFVRVFVDLGPKIIPLLNRLELNEQQLEYVGTIISGFMGDDGGHKQDGAVGVSSRETDGLLEAMSKREREVLELLAQRLTNKEIGERLFIAPETVKRHAHNIFEKLNVSDRRAARAKAIGLGLVSD